MGFYFITTEHLDDRLWFKDEDDYKVGMNYVAVVSYKSGVIVVAFILMSNHVHFLIYCRNRKEAEDFINEYKTMYSRYYRNKYGENELLRRNGVDIQEITPDGEANERIIAYILMNCVAANICLSATDYPWGSGDAFFRLRQRRGKKLGDMSVRERRQKLHSAAVLPEDWILLDEGYVDPASYVSAEYVEKLFKTPKRMNYFLLNSSKAKKTLAANEHSLPSFRDQLIAASIPDLCRSLFGIGNMADLNDRQMTELVKQIKRCFYSDVNQIARVTGRSYKDVAGMLDDY